MSNDLTSDQVVELAAQYGRPFTRRTFSGYVSREQAPQPTRYVGRTPLWAENEIREWLEQGKRQGSRDTERARRLASERASRPLGEQPPS